jgi:predicted phosphodiesterase
VIQIEGRTLAIVSDVHGNSVAFKAALDDMSGLGVDAVISLGDVAATGPSPVDSVRMMVRHRIPSVMGNTDERILRPDASKFNSERGSEIPVIDEWCSKKLGAAEMARISTFKPLLHVQFGSKNILCFHGSPRSNTEVIDASTAEKTIGEIFAGHATELFAGGHTHVQMLRRHGSSQIFNPGSVGLPYYIGSDGSHYRPVRAEYAIIESNGPTLSVRFRRVAYDLDELVRDVQRSGMPHSDWWTSKWKNK